MRKSRQGVLAALRGDLQQLQRQHDELVLLREIERMREQMLMEIIQEQELVSRFKHGMEQHLGRGPASESALQLQLDCDSNSYVISLFSMVQPTQVQQVLTWEAGDWHAFLADAASKLCLLLQLTSRNEPAGPRPAYEPIIEQQLCQVVDEIVTMGALGAIYGEVTGQQLGICTSLNHITMQEEAPQQDHWTNVLQQLQLTQAQLLKLSSAYHEFMRQRKAHRELQSNLSKAVACSNSCTLQLLAAAQSGSEATPSAPGNSSGRGDGVSGGRDVSPRGGGAVTGSPRGADATSMDTGSTSPDDNDAWEEPPPAPPPAPCPSQLMTRLLVMVNQSFSMLFLVLHNTLTRKQIAQMLVASFPFVPRPAPLMEAAAKQLAQLMLGDDCGACHLVPQ